MLRPDWVKINRKVHKFFGEHRFRNASPKLWTKQNISKIIEKFKKASQEEFTSVRVEVECELVCGQTGLGVPEQRPLPAGTNHKRARDDFELDSCSQPPLTSTTTPGDNDPQEPSRKRRCYSEAPEIERCAYRGRVLPLPDIVLPPIEHDDYKMVGKSAGAKKRRYQDFSDAEDFIDLSTGPQSSPPPESESREIVNSDRLQETQEIDVVISAKRIKPNPGRRLKEHGEAVSGSGSKKRFQPVEKSYFSIPSSQASTLDTNAKPGGGDAHNQTTSHGNKKTPDHQWAPYERYLRDTRRSRPEQESGPSIPLASVKESSHPQGVAQMPRVNGPIQPINTLRDNSSNSLRKAVQSNSTTYKPFNLHDGYKRSQPLQNKKQKLEANTSQNGSRRAPISVEDEEENNQQRKWSVTSKSLQSQTQNGHQQEPPRKNGVEEYNSVEERVKPPSQRSRPRSSGLSNGQMQNGKGKTKYLPAVDHMGSFPDPRNIMEDDEDPISDSEMARPSRLGRNTPQVVIESPHKGAAVRRPSQSQLNGRGDSRFTNASTSHRLQAAQDKKHRPQPTEIHSGNGVAVVITENASGSQRNGKLTVRNTGGQQPKQRYDFDDWSEDEISQDPKSRVPRVLADGVQSLEKLESKGTKRRHAEANLGDLSDEEEKARKKADIKPTKFTPSEKPKLKPPPEEKYGLEYVFTEKAKWLVGPSHSIWNLFYSPSSKMLHLMDGEASELWELPLTQIKRIEHDDQSSKLIFHLSRSDSFNGATRIYFQLRLPDESVKLWQSLRSKEPLITMSRKDPSHLQSTFDYQRTSAPAKVKRISMADEPKDIELAKANSERRLGEKRDKTQAPMLTRRHSIDVRESNTIEPDRPKGLAKSMKAQLGSDESSPGIRKESKPAEIQSSSFYTKSPKEPGSSRVTRSEVGTRRLSRRRSPSPNVPIPTPLRWTSQHPDWTKYWKRSVVYKRAAVDKVDIPRLDEGEFLNDSLISFYLQWLEEQLIQKAPAQAKRIYFNNTFFYAALTTNGKGRGINYEAVERWTSKVKLLEYDYIIVPVNEDLHWYLAIICNAPKLLPGSQVVASQSQEELEKLHPQQDKTDGIIKISPSPPSTPSSGPSVNAALQSMSLDENRPTDNKGSGHPNGDLQLKGAPSNESLLSIDRPFDDVKGEKHDLMKNDDEATTQATSKPSTQTKKTRRKSAPNPRKYDPLEPRIITLDSFGHSRSKTCTNLKNYLVLEIKSKLGIDIPVPNSIGMTAKNIPTQDNYCDCGLFLLNYVEKFLENPDGFVHDILQSSFDVETKWRTASDTRTRIRDILFDLQKEQTAEAEKTAQDKPKGKRILKKEVKSQSAPTSNAASPESSESTRLSPGDATGDKPHIVSDLTPDVGQEINPARSKSKGAKQHSSVALREVEKVTVSQAVKNGDLSKGDNSNSKEIDLHNEDIQAPFTPQKPSSGLMDRVVSGVNYVSSLIHTGKNEPRIGKFESGHSFVEITDSPEKQPVGKTGQEPSSSKVPVLEIKDSFEDIPSNDDPCSSSEPLHSGVAEFEDDSGELSNRSRFFPRQHPIKECSVDLVSPPREDRAQATSSVRDRRPTPFPKSRSASPSSTVEGGVNCDSSQPANSKASRIDTSDTAQIASTSDDEMLLPNQSSQSDLIEHTNPPLLSSPGTSSTSVSSPNQNRHDIKPFSSPVTSQEGKLRGFTSSPSRKRKRDDTADLEQADDSHHRTDAAEPQVILDRETGRTHTRFRYTT